MAVKRAGMSVLRDRAARAGTADIGAIHGVDPVGLEVADIGIALGVPHPLRTLDDALASLDERARDIAVGRIYADEPETLAALGDRWDVSRQRIGQLEAEIAERLSECLRGDEVTKDVERLRSLSDQVVRTSRLRGAALALAAGTRHRTTVANALVAASGPWHHDDGWSFHDDVADHVHEVPDRLRDASDDGRTVTASAASGATEGLFEDEGERDAYLEHRLGLGRIGEWWALEDTYRCRAAAALRHLGRPATKEEVADLIDHPDPLRMSGVLGDVEGVVRADKDRWGLIEHVDDPYDGIVGEIEQRIDENGGWVPLDVLLDELPDRFGVSRSSVETYVRTDAFVVVDGRVRIASEDEGAVGDPRDVDGAVHVADKWAQVLELADRHFRGYSLKVHFDIARANGLRPGDSIRVPVVDATTEASLIWRLTDPARSIDVGRVADGLRDLGFAVGDRVAVAPARDSVRIVDAREARTVDRHADAEGLPPGELDLLLGGRVLALRCLKSEAGNAWWTLTWPDGSAAHSGIRLSEADGELPEGGVLAGTHFDFGPVPVYDEESGEYREDEFEPYERTRQSTGEIDVSRSRHHYHVRVTDRSDRGWHVTARVYPASADEALPPPNASVDDREPTPIGSQPGIDDPLYRLLGDR